MQPVSPGHQEDTLNSDDDLRLQARRLFPDRARDRRHESGPVENLRERSRANPREVAGADARGIAPIRTALTHKRVGKTERVECGRRNGWFNAEPSLVKHSWWKYVTCPWCLESASG